MEPISLILAALVSGIIASTKDVASEAVKDAYQGLKTIIKDRYKKVSVETLENKPEDEARQTILQEDLEAANAAADPELVKQAQAVLDAVKRDDAETASTVTVNFRGARIKVLDIGDISATGGGSAHVDAENLESDEVKVGGIKAGGDKGK